jgi:hypothetical protein
MEGFKVLLNWWVVTVVLVVHFSSALDFNLAVNDYVSKQIFTFVGNIV